MNIELQCPECQHWSRTRQVDAAAWTCTACAATIPAVTPVQAHELAACRVCGNAELYEQKDFPHALGMGILVAAFAASVVTYAMYWVVATWVILIGSAALDVLLYLLVPNAVVCYRCHARYRGFAANPQRPAFDLEVGERYRQERLRRKQLDDALGEHLGEHLGDKPGD